MLLLPSKFLEGWLLCVTNLALKKATSHKKLSVKGPTCHPSTKETETGGLPVQSQPKRHNEIPCLLPLAPPTCPSATVILDLSDFRDMEVKELVFESGNT